jgi:uncharacterized protein
MQATDFTPWAGLAGGLLIGLSAVVLMAFNGRIAGASGIFAGLLSLEFDGEYAWRLVFIAGLLIGAAWTGLFFFDHSSIAFAGNHWLTIIGGLLVGAGTKLGAGCTSGHGICGLSRFSLRSLAATITFMAVAIVTVFVVRHLAGS